MWSLPADYDSKVRRGHSLGVSEGGEEQGKGSRGSELMFAIAAFAVIGQSYCLVLDDYAKLLFTPFPHRIHLFAMQADSCKCYYCFSCIRKKNQDIYN